MNYLRVPVDFNKESEEAILDLCGFLNSSSKSEKIELYCSGYGGELIYASMILNAIHRCRGNINFVVDAPCYSAHAAIALSNIVRSREILPYGIEFMVHDTQITSPTDGSHNIAREAKIKREESIRFYKSIGILELMSRREKAEFIYNRPIYWPGEVVIKKLITRDGDKIPKLTSKGKA